MNRLAHIPDVPLVARLEITVSPFGHSSCRQFLSKTNWDLCILFYGSIGLCTCQAIHTSS